MLCTHNHLRLLCSQADFQESAAAAERAKKDLQGQLAELTASTQQQTRHLKKELCDAQQGCAGELSAARHALHEEQADNQAKARAMR